MDQIKKRGKAIPKIETCTHGRSESRKSDIIRETNFLIKPYAEKYALDLRPKILLGINFSRTEKTIDDWLMEEHPS